jgi:ATP-dependent protease ClpP protease subunit
MKKIYISGEIGWDVYPDDFRKQLESAKGEDLDIYIASPGGYVSDGLEIFNMIRDYKRDNPQSQIMATIKGVAASMATYLIVNPAIDYVTAEDNAVFMIHNVWGAAVGDYRDMIRKAEIFEGLTNIIAKAYQKKTKKKLDNIRDMMDNETWLFGDEILDMGFVDDMVKADGDKDKNSAITEAKMVCSELSKKIHEKENDYQKIAASIKKPEFEPVNGDNNKIKTPAEVAGKIKSGGVVMTLEELKAQHPALYNQIFNDGEKAGIKKGKEEMQKSITQASAFLSPDSTYPNPIKAIAIEVLKGEKSIGELTTTVSAFDALKEANNSNNASEDTDDQGSTPGDQTPPPSGNGEITNEIDFNHEVNRSKKLVGLEA